MTNRHEAAAFLFQIFISGSNSSMKNDAKYAILKKRKQHGRDHYGK